MCVNKNIKEASYDMQIKFKINCPTIDGKESIKQAIETGYGDGDGVNDLDISLLNVPLYTINYKTTEKDVGKDIVLSSYDKIKASIESKEGSIEIINKSIVNTLNNDMVAFD